MMNFVGSITLGLIASQFARAAAGRC